eukprot:Partr_v1_DN25132_c0_g1_i1_m76939 putative Dehydrogenase
MKIHRVGIIGLGDMGQLYARKLAASPGLEILVCDLPERYEYFQSSPLFPQSNIHVVRDGRDVCRQSDFVIYSVETEKLSRVVEMYGPCSKYGSVVGGQTSVKQPEIAAFDQYLPEDVHVVTMHSLHGPNIDTVGQPLVVMRHRASDKVYRSVMDVLSHLGSDVVELSCAEHDAITADTQAVTHLAFLSMGSAWRSTGVFPWLSDTYVGGIENAKVMMTLRIYGSKWHVYAGLALLNPAARRQISQYASSVSDLFKMMIQEDSVAFRKRLTDASTFVFGKASDSAPILLSDDWLDEFSLGSGGSRRRPNSHLSLLAIVDSWSRLSINPYHHMICQTPPFRAWLGITEYLFKTPDLLEQSINAALFDKSIRADDLEFVNATQAWSQCILLGSMEGYQEKFEDTAQFFAGQSAEAKKLSTAMLTQITKKSKRVETT